MNNRRKFEEVGINVFRRTLEVSRRERIRNENIAQRIGLVITLTTHRERKHNDLTKNKQRKTIKTSSGISTSKSSETIKIKKHLEKGK